MIPVPRGPGDVLPSPEDTRPIMRGGEPMPLVMQALADLDVLKRTLGDLTKRIESVEHRVAALESPKS